MSEIVIDVSDFDSSALASLADSEGLTIPGALEKLFELAVRVTACDSAPAVSSLSSVDK